ncbi:L-Lysine-8-amino-7-oxononanoate aminotransferase [Planctomycetes bacterium Pan216]|uniref:Adenosylmethionine-8-amino-7-oxononanoate aminotransferase n=1 Tax=Kolteria novifilia TaxID=2527975 RepID=A0A518BCY1_9BACT|nr:L-Lysine-8-amino-7-oxononanoate aminotransferase [Planctomycetes bacterium Pan216]
MPSRDELTARYRQWDNDHVWHPFTPMQAHCQEEVPIITAAEGFELIDTDGHRYLDGVSSLWCNVHGHRVPEIDQAIRDQLDQFSHSTLLGLGGVPSIELAKDLVGRLPKGLTRVFYSDSGATAVEAAIKIAYQYQQQRPGGDTSRDRFVTLGNAYHGDTIGSVSVGGVELFHGVYKRLLFPTFQVPSPVAYRTPEGHNPQSYLEFCFDELERTFCESGDRVAAMIIEPLVQGAAGIQVHAEGYLKKARELTAKYGALLIADEVAVGCGRTGTFLACEQEEVVPDLVCLAKGLTGGYLPVATTVATEEVHEAFLGDPSELRTFFHGHTYTGNALGCAAALASLRLYDSRRILENVGAIAERLRRDLTPLNDDDYVGEIRQKGTMVGIELVRDKETKEPFPYGLRMGHRVTLEARKRGVIIRPLGNVVVLMPPLAMPVDLVARLVDVTIQAIEAATKEVGLGEA